MKNDLIALNGKKAWSIAILLFFTQVINYFDKTVIGLAAVPIMRELGLTPQQYGLVASSFFSLYAISGVTVGFFLAHRVSAKMLLTVLVVIWSLAQLPIIFFTSLWTLVACRVVLGIGEGPGSPTATSALHEWFTPDRRNMPTALLMMGVSVGSFVAGPVLSYVIIGFGWRAAFVVCSGLGLCWLVFWQLFGADGPDSAVVRAKAPLPDQPPATIGQRAIWADPTIIASIVMGFAAYWVTGFTVAWLAPLIRVGLGFDPAATGWIMSAIAGTNTVLMLAISYGSQRLLTRGRSSRVARGIVNAACMLSGGAALIAAASITDPIAKLVLLAIGGGLPTLTFTLGPALVSGIVPLPHRSRFLIMIYAGITTAGFLSPLAAGFLIGERGLDGYNAALDANALVVILGGMVGLLFLRPERSASRFAAIAARAA